MTEKNLKVILPLEKKIIEYVFCLPRTPGNGAFPHVNIDIQMI